MPDEKPVTPAYNANENCGKCKFWNRADGHETKEGICRRFPPQYCNLPIAIEHGIAIKASFLFPSMMDFNWCGEFRPKISSLN